MSSFFTTPASQRKRKRNETSASSSKRNITSTSTPARAPRREEREESISGSDSSDNEGEEFFTPETQEGSDSSEDENETAAEKRLRLAERYLENIRDEVEDDVGFDAAQIDKDLIAERLKEDVAETKGKIYRHIAKNFDLERASRTFAKSEQYCITGCAARLPYAWTISKDMVVAKWEIVDPKTYTSNDSQRPTNISPRKAPKRVKWRWGNRHKSKDAHYIGHTGAIVSIAISGSGKYLATGDEKSRLIIWNADTLEPLKMFTQHRAEVTSLSFRRGTDQLFSASADRTIKIWSASELAYVETLFGHQDTVVGIAGGLETNQETCVSVGGRDRTARLWKVVEENQLVFRGGGTARQKGMEKLRKGRFGRNVDDDEDEVMQNGRGNAAFEEEKDPPIAYVEGSMDCVAFLDAGLFVTGSDNGGISLWSVHKKKPVWTVPLAHGRDPPIPAEEMSADADAIEKGVKGPRLPRYITALTAVPYADLILSASWDGWVRAWKVADDKRSIEELGPIGKVDPNTQGEASGNALNDDYTKDRSRAPVRGIINGLSVCERGDRGKEGLCVIAAIGKEHRLGRWMKGKSMNGIVVFEIPKKSINNGPEVDSHDEEGED